MTLRTVAAQPALAYVAGETGPATLVRGGAGTVYAASDVTFANPLTIYTDTSTEANKVTKPGVNSDVGGLIQSFKVDVPESEVGVRWVSGTYRVGPIPFVEGYAGATPDITPAVVTGAPGTAVSVAKTGTPEKPTLTFTIPEGQKGDTGPTPALSATATTGAPGSAAAVTVSGTPEAPVFNIAVPEGRQGLPGVNAVPADEAVATYASTPGSQTATALNAAIDETTMNQVFRNEDGTSRGVTPGQHGLINWNHQQGAGSGYLIHVTSGPGFGGAGLIGVGVDTGGPGIIVSRKSPYGTGILIGNTPTTVGSYGLFMDQKSTSSEGVYIEQAVAGAAVGLHVKASVSAAGQVLSKWTTPLGTAGTVAADSGNLTWYGVMRSMGNKITSTNATTAPGEVLIETNATEARLRLYRPTAAGASATQYPFQITTATDVVNLQTSLPAAKGAETWQSNISMGVSAGGAKLGFFGVAPSLRPKLTYSRAGETTQQAQIRSALSSLGLISDETVA